ncbi:hypothetical protein KYC5002_12500 [Archangium violaceum]|uniref:hypothetical protein n=1 Tax=Archangium violaceum TaxID=83451 RepID=UPI002B31E559|nr:hypothetical protein KYC5002_12500 [Archangium gephyra]
MREVYRSSRPAATSAGELRHECLKPGRDPRRGLPGGAAGLFPLRTPRKSNPTPSMMATSATLKTPVDVVAEGYDAGLRYGEWLAQDMVAVPSASIRRAR